MARNYVDHSSFYFVRAYRNSMFNIVMQYLLFLATFINFRKEDIVDRCSGCLWFVKVCKSLCFSKTLKNVCKSLYISPTVCKSSYIFFNARYWVLQPLSPGWARPKRTLVRQGCRIPRWFWTIFIARNHMKLLHRLHVLYQKQILHPACAVNAWQGFVKVCKYWVSLVCKSL